jgi:hypothetical protein
MRILQISTHTTLRPRHGGQLRSHHIGRVIEAAGFDLKRLAIAYKTPDDPIDAREPLIDISQSKAWWRMIDNGPMELNDFFALRAVLEERALTEQVLHAIRAADPDVVMLEHPWMWPLVKGMELVASGRIRVIYNSQNVEAHLKRHILNEAGYKGVDKLLWQVEELESDLVRLSAAMTVCTKLDGDVFAGWGATRIVVANNGAVRPNYDHLVGILPQPLEQCQKYALAIGSNHPPNLAGLKQLVTPALKFLRPLQRIVVAGGVCGPFNDWLQEQGLLAMANDRMVLLGPVSELCLNSLIANASVMLLPIPYGGGSNVKTAEALLSGKRVVATASAMRGFTEFQSLPAVDVADNEQSFAEAILEAFDAGSPAPYDGALLDSLLWDNTLAPIVALLKDFASGRASERGALQPHDQILQG